ncbi:MAG: 3-phosphoshikimate 1-carboxyvinyltransferase, partial [Candidatus Paceibacteria bacterium]
GALRALGIETQETGHSLIIGPSQGLGPAQAEPLTLDPEGDHRMAFAFSLLGLVRPNLRVSNAGCVAKSWPTFWEDMGCS